MRLWEGLGLDHRVSIPVVMMGAENSADCLVVLAATVGLWLSILVLELVLRFLSSAIAAGIPEMQALGLVGCLAVGPRAELLPIPSLPVQDNLVVQPLTLVLLLPG